MFFLNLYYIYTRARGNNDDMTYLFFVFFVSRDLNDFRVVETSRDDVKEIERRYTDNRLHHHHIIIKSFDFADNPTADCH